MKLERIVIGMDFSRHSVAALEWGARVFAPTAELVLVHGVTSPPAPHFLAAHFPQLGGLEENTLLGARSRVADVVSAMTPLARERLSHVDVAFGPPAERLVTIAREMNADAIVIGRHGQRTGRWDHLGSTADAVVRASPVAVMVAAGTMDGPPRRVLVALDDDELTGVNLAWTRMLGCGNGTHVTAVHVLSNAVLSHVLSVEAVKTKKVDFRPSDIRKRFRHEAERWAEQLVAGGVTARQRDSEVAFGDPGRAILSVARRIRADLIIVGRRGVGRLHRLVIGSVATEVLRRAQCPVLVSVPPPESERADAPQASEALTG